MTDEKKGGDAEKTGEFVGGSLKQGWGAVKSFGKGVKKGFQKKRNKNNTL